MFSHINLFPFQDAFENDNDMVVNGNTEADPDYKPMAEKEGTTHPMYPFFY